jgi:HlyD family secretion protein
MNKIMEIIKSKPVLAGGIAAATLLSGGILAWGVSQSNLAPKSQPNTSSAPKPAPKISALGRIEPAGEIVKVSAPLSLDGDRLKELRVREGDTVRPGAIIAVLDSVDRLQASLTQAQHQVSAAQAKLAQVKAGAKPGEVAAQKATIDRTQVQIQGETIAQQQAIARIKAQWQGERNAQQEAIARIKAQWAGDRNAQTAAVGKLQVEFANARSELTRHQQLAQAGAISQSVLDGKKLAVASFNQQLQEARAVLARIDNTSRKQLTEAQAILNRIEGTNSKQLTEAQAILNRIEGTGKGQVAEARATLAKIAEVRDVDIRAVATEVDSAIAAQSRAQTELDRAYIRAPIGGQILKINTRMGEKITDKGIVDLANTSDAIVVAEVYQTDIGKIKLGQKATITSQAFAGELKGTVDWIGLQVNRQNVYSDRPGENLDRRVIEVKIKLDPSDRKIVSGLTNLQVQAKVLTIN